MKTWSVPIKISFLSACFTIAIINTSVSQSCHLNWLKTIEQEGEQRITDAVFDNDGNAYICGFFKNKVFIPNKENIDTIAIGSNGNSYMVKFDSKGEVVWYKILKGKGNPVIELINNKIIFTGWYNLTSTKEVKFIPVFNEGKDTCYSIENIEYLGNDKDGNLLVTGGFRDSLDFDPSENKHLLKAKASSDIYFAKYTSIGDLLWVQQIKGDGSEGGIAIIGDKKGNTILAAGISKPLDLDESKPGYELNGNSYYTTMLNKYDGNGNLLWYKQLEGEEGKRISKIFINESNEIFITGFFSGDIKFTIGGIEYKSVSKGDDDIFLAKLSEDGEYLWYKTIGGKKVDFGSDIAVDKMGNVIMTGSFQDVVDFNTGSAVKEISSKGDGYYNGFIQIYDKHGYYLNTFPLLSDQNVYGDRIFINDFSELTWAGMYSKNVDFDLTSDTFIKSSLSYTGTFIANYQYLPSKPYFSMEEATDWKYNVYNFNLSSSFYMSYIKDTVINSKTYRLIVNPDFRNKNNDMIVRFDNENRTVYEYNVLSQSEVLIYDFNLKLGSDFYVPYTSMKFTVIRIDTVESNIGPLLKWFFSDGNRNFSYTELRGGQTLNYYETIFISDPVFENTCVYDNCELLFGLEGCEPAPIRQFWDSLSVDICFGDVFEGHEKSGTYITKTLNGDGCPINRVLQLNVSEKPIEFINSYYICEGSSINLGGTIISNSGIFYDTLFKSNNCIDKTYKYIVEVINVDTLKIDSIICEGQSLFGKISSGNYLIDTIDLLTGCPLKYNLFLTVLPVSDPSCISIAKNNFDNSLMIYPNPADDFIELELNNSTEFNFELISMQGRMVLEQNLKNCLKYKIDTKILSEGLYIYRLCLKGKQCMNGLLFIKH